jgi:hypothetical protein
LALTLALTVCAVCGDRFQSQGGCCGRCNRMVCTACSRPRGRSHESVMCDQCTGAPRPTGLKASSIYRTWKRLAAS